MFSVIYKTNIIIKVIGTLPMDNPDHNTQLPEIQYVTGTQPNNLKRPTEFS